VIDMPPAALYEAVFDPTFREDLAHWTATDPRLVRRALALVEAILRAPCEGAGRPRPLKELPATWSRRLTQDHRVVYRVADHRVYFLQARYHYGP
jgi:toxin YoeB